MTEITYQYVLSINVFEREQKDFAVFSSSALHFTFTGNVQKARKDLVSANILGFQLTLKKNGSDIGSQKEFALPESN